MLELPKDLLSERNSHKTIKLHGCTIIESCLFDHQLEDTAFVFEHELIYIRSGELKINNIRVLPGEAILLKKDTYFNFIKTSQSNNENYQSVLFFLKKEFIEEFISKYQLKNNPSSNSQSEFFKLPKNDIIKGFISSLLPYFDTQMDNDKEILKLKTFELLFNISNLNPNFFSYFYQLKNTPKKDLIDILEKNYTKNLSLIQFASLSGRSLSTFKRDFKKIFNTSPAKWIKEKRLKLAHYLLLNTDKKPTDIYIEVGFEDYSHFSKQFKKQFGILPSTL